MLTAIRLSGVSPQACASFAGAINGEWFLNYVRVQLPPSLLPCDMAVMGNLPAHKVKGVEQAIREADAELWYLPTYSLDLNPIESMGSKAKARIRKARARCEKSLFQAIGHALQTVTAEYLDGFYEDAGYATGK